MKNTGGLAQLKAIRETLKNGGYVRFNWVASWPILVSADQEWFSSIDGRSYQAFLLTADSKYIRTQTGSVDTRDLVIEWRQNEDRPIRSPDADVFGATVHLSTQSCERPGHAEVRKKSILVGDYIDNSRK